MKIYTLYSKSYWGVLIFGMILLLTSPLSASAQTSLLSFGVRGGGMTYCTNTSQEARLGGNGFVDIGYACYWWAQGVDMGIRTGLSAGYGGFSFVGNESREFQNTDYLGNVIEYTTSATGIRQDIQALQLEIPLMFALRSEHLFVNVGAKLMMPVMNTSQQSMSALTIDAYYREVDVHVVNRMITGTPSAQVLKTECKNCLPQYHVLLGIEFGYEWQLRGNGCIGLGIYGDLSPWNSGRVSCKDNIVEVAPISDPLNPPAQVTINPITSTIDGATYYLDFGIKCYYGINFSHGYRR